MPQFGWNPLLGVRPEATYAELEALALAQSPQAAQLQLYGEVPSHKNDRWAFRCNNDGLVHALMPLYATKFWGYAGNAVPVEAVTECGTPALLVANSTQLGVYDAGSVIPEQHSTCLACASGIDRRGSSIRQTQKQRNFGQMYGMTGLGRTNMPPMQQMPRTISPSQVSKYSLKALAQQFPEIWKYTQQFPPLKKPR